MKKYAGVGSRSCPLEMLDEIKHIGQVLAEAGWLLRSGNADGCDLAFEQGCDLGKGLKEIYLPWKGFNNSTSPLYTPSQDAFVLASTIHPAWDKLSFGAKKLHARNCHQVLGIEFDDPISCIIAWTKNGKQVGGTATALKLAQKHGIKIINLAIEKFDYNLINKDK